MAGIKELRLRIKSVGSIKQITRAMEMVATTKLRRFQDRATASRPYTEEITGLMGRLVSVLGDDVTDRPLFRQGAGDKTLALVVSSDRGLCGAYNANLLRTLEEWRAAVAEVRRVLKPGGRVLVSNFAPSSRPRGRPMPALEGEPDRYLWPEDRRMVLLDPERHDAEFAAVGLLPAEPTETVRVPLEEGYRVSINALYVAE